MKLNGIEADQGTINMEEVITIDDEMHGNSWFVDRESRFVRRKPFRSYESRTTSHQHDYR